MILSASLVLFNNSPRQYELAIRSFLEGSNGLLYVVDNSAEPLCHPLFSHQQVRYIYTGVNLGFGKAHNIALRTVAGASDVHLFLNPDVEFDVDVLPHLLTFLEDRADVGAVMPRVIYPNGDLQRLCKLLPTPVDLILRRFIPLRGIRDSINRRYEMHWLAQDVPTCVPTLSGCFLMIRSELLRRVGGFDERFFMYMEDVDLVRRVGDFAQTVYLPSVQIVHGYAKGSYRNRKLLCYHLRSALQYFSKWGWLWDRTRRDRNRAACRLAQTLGSMGK